MKIENVLNDGISYIQLQDVMGTDLSIVNAARVSYLGESKGIEADKKLLQYLWRHKHTSPFEMAVLKIKVHCPLFVRSQWHRHRTFSYNEISRRYTSENLEFYYPEKWRMQDKVNKQGSDLIHSQDDNDNFSEWLYDATGMALECYNKLLDNNVSREMARMVLPQNLYTTFIATGNLRNWLHFIELRSDHHAQWEIRQYSDAILHKFVKEHFPWTYQEITKDTK